MVQEVIQQRRHGGHDLVESGLRFVPGGRDVALGAGSAVGMLVSSYCRMEHNILHYVVLGLSPIPKSL